MKTTIRLTPVILLLAVSNLSATTLYVSHASANPTPPYGTWATAATNLQDAVDAAQPGDVVLVTNGVYAGGLAVGMPLTLLGVNGAQFTVIDGGRANQCVSITNNVSLFGFTLTNGWAQNGGGLWCNSTNAYLTNCIIAGNSAAQNGGGVHGATLYNCLLTGNSAPNGIGGGAYASMLYNCTVSGNSANSGGGASGGILYNSIVYYNTAANGANYTNVLHLLYCCTVPDTVWGKSNIIDAPVFVDYAGGNLRLQSNSPCIKAGNVAYAHGSTDLDGNPRILGGTVDIGAYEFQGSGGPPVVPRPQVSYVRQDSPNPTPPYTNWATAAQAIQDAVDAVASGGLVLVTNGTYATGGRTVGASSVLNRVVVDKPVTLQSVNGPLLTVIEGFQVPGSINGSGAIRCAYLTDGATVSGFTLTNGATSQHGGDWYAEQSGGGVWCGSSNATITNCILAGNSAAYAGGGAYGGRLYNCTLLGNRVRGDNGSDNSVGGGADAATLIHCTVSGNRAEGQYGCGGGAATSSLFECTVRDNSAVDSGGGVYLGCAVTNCTLTGNSTGGYGGGARGENGGICTLYNCVLSGNSAGSGGGASGCQLYNCTLTGNSVDHLASFGLAYSGGGVSFCSLLNCIVYYNTAVWGSANYDPASTLNHCCTTPLPAGGSGNIAREPLLATASHISVNSPCRGAGLAGSATGTDIDGQPWANPPSIGCVEYYAGDVTGPLSVAITAAVTIVAAGSPVPFTAVIDGRASASVWDFGDGVIVSNWPYASHAWTLPGDYAVALRAYNDSQPSGVGATVTVHVPAQSMHYVAVDSTNPVPPFTSWPTAATKIQDAVDAALAGDQILVADGLYAGGGRAVGTNLLVTRVAVTNPVALRSVNGPKVTVIQGAQAPGGGNGDGAIRCVHLANGASLFGFTLTNGATRMAGDPEGDQGGGGIWCESTSATVSNCIVVGNSAAFGGGALKGTFYNCLLTSNSISGGIYGGGGAYQSTLYNCTVTGNSAPFSRGGGVSGGILYNCIVYYNTARFDSNYTWFATLNYCATTPTPTNGIGNAPLFVDGAAGNLHLQSASPCINSGNNAFVRGKTDLDGNPRIVGGTVDMGAYEFQRPSSVISYAWLQQYGLPTDGSADFIDTDGDGMNNWQEWVCGTDPTNPLSVLRMLSAAPAATNVAVSWQSVAGIRYFLERTANLNSSFTLPATNSAWATNLVLVATNIAGQADTTTYTDTNVAGRGPFFYRVGVKGP